MRAKMELAGIRILGPLQAAIAELIETSWPLADGMRLQRIGELLARHVDHSERVVLSRVWGW